MWGKRGDDNAPRRRYRFTPTGVGKTPGISRRRHRSPVHPHRCGENRRVLQIVYLFNGSPPQVWGKHHQRRAGGDLQRFTPTGVGKTAKPGAANGKPSVHPHRCGENGDFKRFIDYTNGSPPQVWGKLPALAPDKRCGRFTPTGVGKTRQYQKQIAHQKVHPHRCGENICYPCQDDTW